MGYVNLFACSGVAELMPQAEQSLRVTFNVHFEHEGLALPAEKDLEAAYHHEFQAFKALLVGLFVEEK